jgi:hypothetical protein
MNTRIALSGQTFIAGKDVPLQLQQQVEQFVQGLADQNGNGVPDVLEGSANGVVQMAKSQQFIINGRRYGSLEEMPLAERKLFEQMRGLLIDQTFGNGQATAGGAGNVPSLAINQDASAPHQGVYSASPTFLSPGREGSDLAWFVQLFVLLLGIAIGLAIAVAVWFALK